MNEADIMYKMSLIFDEYEEALRDYRHPDPESVADKAYQLAASTNLKAYFYKKKRDINRRYTEDRGGY
jgi:hypothetical protein